MSTQETPPKRPRFNVQGVATIKHLNVRKEGPEDEKVLAVDVKLVIEKLPRTICDYFDEALVPFLWRGDPATDALIVRNAFLRPIAYAHEVSSAFVRIDNGVFRGCDVGKFSLEPRDGGTVDLTCSVAIYPSANDVSDLAKHVQDGVHVAIEGPPDLFNADDKPAAAAAELDGLMRESGASAVLSSSDGSTVLSFGDGPDPLLDAARALVLEHSRASISLVQRHLRIGYNRAARLLEELEKAGVISSQNKDGQRSVLAAS